MPPATVFVGLATLATVVLPYSSAVHGRWGLLSIYLRYIPLLTLLQLAAWIIWRWFLYPKMFSTLRHVPGPKGGSFFMGHFLENIKEHPGAPLRRWAEELPHNGVIRFLDIFNSERIVPVSPAALADVLVHKNYDFEKPAPLRKGISRILGLGLFLAEGDEHKRQRKTLTPAFAFRHIKDLYPVFWAKSQALVEAIMAQTEISPLNEKHVAIVEVNEWASRATLDIVGVAGMGQDFHAIEDPANKLNQTYRSLFKPSRFGQFFGVLGALLPSWIVRNLPFKRNDDIKIASEFIRQTCFSLIDTKKTAMRKGQSGFDILSVALSSGGFSDEDLVDQMMTFLAAGHETTASGLTWAIYLLCKHPSVQVSLREEIHNNLPDPLGPKNATLTSGMIDNLPYLNAVCQETFRLFPPVSVTIREAVVDTSILDIAIPKGTTLLLSPWAVNRSAALWGEDAMSFNPDRWLQSPSGGADSNFSFLTFLHGPRSCIGQSFAKAEFACLLAAWVSSFETELVEKEKDVEIRGGITLKPKDGLWVKVSASQSVRPREQPRRK